MSTPNGSDPHKNTSAVPNSQLQEHILVAVSDLDRRFYARIAKPSSVSGGSTDIIFARTLPRSTRRRPSCLRPTLRTAKQRSKVLNTNSIPKHELEEIHGTGPQRSAGPRQDSSPEHSPALLQRHAPGHVLHRDPTDTGKTVGHAHFPTMAH